MKDVELLGVSSQRRECDLRVSPAAMGQASSFLSAHNFSYTTVHADLQAGPERAVSSREAEEMRVRSGASGLRIADFHLRMLDEPRRDA